MGIRSHIEENYDFDIVDEFLDHYNLMSESMETIVINISDEDMRERSIDELFRIIHNIKSASAYLEIISMNRLAALVEDELEDLRNLHKPVSQEAIDWLIRISDMFATWNDDLKQDNELSRVTYSLLKLPDMEELN
ncbi:MAG: Hpt domain-containing protein [Campylobacterota bacterium]|nr:Hpt domain-containing protein [Campylobacterota bacterium]